MKHIQPNPTNLSIAVVYSFFGLLSFFILKIAVKYFKKGQKGDTGKKSQVDSTKISRKHLQAVNFSKVFLKTYFLKNTLLGSIVNKDKKYLLKQIFVLSCMAASCFNINNYIIWPWGIGFGMALTTLIISQIFIPMTQGSNLSVELVDQQIVSNLNEHQSMGSIQIEINTKVEMKLSNQRQQPNSKKVQQEPTQSHKQKSPNLEIIFIMLLAFISQVLICISIVNLGLSVSNSGILNLISFGIAIVIDQVGARICIGLTAYIILFALQKKEVINLLQNNLFYSCCSQAISQDLKRVHQEAQIDAINNKVANLKDHRLKIINDTGAKMIHQNKFLYQEQVANDIMIPLHTNLQKQAVLEEQDEEDESKDQTKIQKNHQFNQVEQQPTNILKDQTNYFELYEHDIESFTQQIMTTERSNGKAKKIKKRVVKPQEKIRSDPLLYFPFEQHKLNSHRNSVKQDLKQFQSQISLFEKQKTSITDNFLKNIEVLECIQDSIVTEEEVFGTILNEKNFNIKTLAVNQKAQIPPTSRRGHSATKRSVSKESMAVKKVKKVSPYFVDLQSQAVKPQKSQKQKKPTASKINKENANQTNQSFTPTETIQGSHIEQKEFMSRTNWINNGNIAIGRRQ